MTRTPSRAPIHIRLQDTALTWLDPRNRYNQMLTVFRRRIYPTMAMATIHLNRHHSQHLVSGLR